MHEHKKHNFLLILVLFLGIFLLTYGIEWGLPNENLFFSHKSDENIYVRSLSEMSISTLDFNPHFFYWGSWHFYELGMVFKLAKTLRFIKVVPDKEFYYYHPAELSKVFLAGRLLSVVFSILTLYLVYRIGKIIYNKNVGLLSAFFLAIMPANIINSHFLKADASVTFWITLLLFFSILIYYFGNLKYYIFAGFALGFASGSQYNGVLFGLTILFAHLLRESNSITFKNIYKKIFEKRLIFGYIVTISTFLISCPYIILAFSEFKTYLVDMFTVRGFTNIEPREFFILDTLKLFYVGMTWPFVVLSILSCMFIFFRAKKEYILIILWFLPYTIYIIASGTLATRFQMLILPGLCIIVSLTIFKILKFKKGLVVKIPAFLIIGLTSLYALAYTFAYDKVLSSEPIQDKATKWLLRNIPGGSTIGIAERPYIENVPTVIHQDYFYSKEKFWSPRFKIFNMEFDILKLKEFKPRYFIISERQNFFGNNRDLNNVESKKSLFLKALLNEYEVLKSFKNELKLLNFKFKPAKVILSDWNVPFFKIYILHRR